jgi:hypothetical protein
MAYEIVKESEAPPIPAAAVKLSTQAKEITEMLTALLKGGVGKVPVPEGKDAKGLRIGIGRIASNSGYKDRFITYTADPPDGFVYIRARN